MNMLLEALNSITDDIDYGRLYSSIRNEIMNTVGVEKDGKPTNIWLAGLATSRGSAVGKVNRLIQSYLNKELDPDSKDYRDAVRTKIAMDALKRVKLIGTDSQGRYTFPQSQTPLHDYRRGQLSNLRTSLTRDFHTMQDGNNVEKSFRGDRDAAIADMVAKMPPEQKRFADMFSTITISAYNLLVNLNTKRGPKDVARLRDTMNTGGFKDSQDLLLLQNLGLVNDDKKLNRGEMAKFEAFIAAANAPQLIALNTEVSKLTRNSQHTRQRSLNAVGKGYGPDDEMHTPDDAQFADDMNDDEDRAINSRIRNIDAGTKNSSKNARAAGYNHTFSDMFRKSLS